ncbi:hypothetical protein MCUN1_003310 [Malassezia cuniculi]|uniref:Abscisic acid G-protein coupled receptor-domain-containing protein n=1 Tax=Malassezia cuniculi TaxID=948313 RepID=A0AAF0EY60_9BASI|nr:hypothetical protein MCUN1_003310 [Malassezia cuniculi]
MADSRDLVLVAAVRSGLGACAYMLLPYILGEAYSASLDPGAPAELALPGVATMAHRAARLKDAVRSLAKGLGASPTLRAASILFCIAFEESAILFCLVLLENVHEGAPWLLVNWRISMAVVLILIVLAIPLCACVLICFGGSTGGRIRSLRGYASIALFFLWVQAYARVPLPAAMTPALQGFLGTVLARAAVIGVPLIAILSGSAAGGAIWDSYESMYRQRPVQGDIASARSAYERTISDLQARQAALADMINDADGREPPRAAELRGEVFALDSLANALRDDCDAVEDAERRARYEKTATGKLLLLGNHVFSAYCAFRIVISVLSLLVLGYRDTAPPDLVSLALVYIVKLLGVDVDVGAWAPQISLMFVGILILMRMRVLLRMLSGVIRKVSAGVSTSFLVLATGEVLCIYSLATLIQLRTAIPTSSRPAVLLNMLPEFQVVFGSLFDTAFLAAAGLTMGIRWFHMAGAR